MNYSEDLIHFAFHHQVPGTLSPDSARLNRFDQDLFDTFDALIVEKLTGAGLPTDKRTRSSIALLALMSNGSTPKAQVSLAVRYFGNVTG